jgi:hypothetical protein
MNVENMHGAKIKIGYGRLLFGIWKNKTDNNVTCEVHVVVLLRIQMFQIMIL